jgi:hypothetical protein
MAIFCAHRSGGLPPVAVVFGCAGLALMLASSAHAARVVTLGPSDGIAIDQPRVAMEVFTQPAPGVSLGPEFSNTFLLDTGATAISAFASATDELNQHGFQTQAIYDEQGVAGFTPMGVSVPYRVDFAGTDGARLSLPNVRMLSTSDLDLDFPGIVGMPAMVGRTTTVSMREMITGPDGLLGVHFSAAPPASPGHRYSVPLSMVTFPPTGQRSPTDPLPTDAPLPFVNVNVTQGNLHVSGKFLVDTGAQFSMLSTATAFALGLDTNGDFSFEQEKIGDLGVGGIGGSTSVPVVAVNSLALPTQQGTDLVWTNLSVGVLDIDPKIAGVFGMDFLTSGWLSAVFLGGEGYINQVHFDFRDAANLNGTMLLDLAPASDVVVDPFPWQNPINSLDVNGDSLVDALDLQLVRDALSSQGPHALGTPSGQITLFDVNGDNYLSALDLLTLSKAIAEGRTSLSSDIAPIPEPGTFALLLLGGAVLAVPPAIRRLRKAA